MDHDIATRGTRRWFAPIGTLAVGAASLFALIVMRDLPPAAPGYTVSVAAGVTTRMAAGRVAAIARHYLDLQTSELAAPELHADPVVHSVAAVRAVDSAGLEPAVPAEAVAADPGRIVWVASVTGDLLNLHDLAWSRPGAGYPSGRIVIDDATGSILGVFPGTPKP